MRHEIKYGPSYSLGILSLDAGESVQAETGSMVSMSDGIRIETSMGGGGLFGGLKRAIGGESLFINQLIADRPGEVTIAPTLPGDMVAIDLTGQTVLVQSGSFLAATPGVTIDSKWGGSRGFFSGEGLILLRCTGQGTLFLSSYGAIHTIDLGPEQRYIVDTGHMVAFDDTVRYEVGKAGGWKSTILGGEGLVVNLTGPGRFFLQTRSPGGLVQWLVPQMPFKRD
ncbi:MAG: TIGR00266 family protein [Chloroflexi bacterium]|nr:TIGR00266 family protein [Chloroflexota bacterium]